MLPQRKRPSGKRSHYKQVFLPSQWELPLPQGKGAGSFPFSAGAPFAFPSPFRYNDREASINVTEDNA